MEKMDLIITQLISHSRELILLLIALIVTPMAMPERQQNVFLAMKQISREVLIPITLRLGFRKIVRHVTRPTQAGLQLILLSTINIIRYQEHMR